MKGDLQTRKATIIGSSHQFFGMLLVPVLIPYLLSQGFSDQQIAFYWMIFPLIGIFASLGVGEAVKKIHVSWLLFAAIVINASAIPFYIIALDWSIIIGRILDGLSFTTITVLSLTKLEAHINKKRGNATGKFLLFQQTAKYSSPILGGFLGEIHILVPMVLSLFALLGLAFSIKHPSFFREEKIKLSLTSDLRDYWKNKNMRFSIFTGTIGNLLLVFRDLFIPLIIISQLGLTVKSVGIATSFFGIGGLAQIYWGRLSDKFHHDRMMVVSVFFLALGWIMVALFVNSFGMFLFTLFIISCAQALFNVSTLSFIGAEPHKDVGTDFSFYATISKIAVFVGTGIVGVLLAIYSYQTIILVIASFAVVATFFVWIHFIDHGE